MLGVNILIILKDDNDDDSYNPKNTTKICWGGKNRCLKPIRLRRIQCYYSDTKTFTTVKLKKQFQIN